MPTHVRERDIRRSQWYEIYHLARQGGKQDPLGWERGLFDACLEILADNYQTIPAPEELEKARNVALDVRDIILDKAINEDGILYRMPVGYRCPFPDPDDLIQVEMYKDRTCLFRERVKKKRGDKTLEQTHKRACRIGRRFGATLVSTCIVRGKKKFGTVTWRAST